jgi:hypothetical protein
MPVQDEGQGLEDFLDGLVELRLGGILGLDVGENRRPVLVH